MNSGAGGAYNRVMDDQQQQRGVRLTPASGCAVTVLVDGEFRPSEVSVSVGGRILSAENANVEAVEGRHGALFTADVAEMLARYQSLVGRACLGVLAVDGVAMDDALDALERSTLERAGDDADEARVQMMVARQMIPVFAEG